jgi:hypothetical protein
MFRYLEGLDDPYKHNVNNDFISRFYITTQIKRIKTIKETLTKQEIIDILPSNTFRNEFNFKFYRNLYLNEDTFPIAVDATASAFQILSVLFGDINIATQTNLMNTSYIDFYDYFMNELPSPDDLEN